MDHLNDFTMIKNNYIRRHGDLQANLRLELKDTIFRCVSEHSEVHQNNGVRF